MVHLMNVLKLCFMFQMPVTLLRGGLIIWLFFSQIALAQTKEGGIAVTGVNIENGRPLEQITVVLISRQGETVDQASTNASGKVTLDNIPPGLYELRADKVGYRSVVEPSVRVLGGKTIPIRLQMQFIDKVEEEVIVVARAETTSDTVNINATRVDREALRSAPGSGSDVLRALDGLPGLTSTNDFASFTVRGRGPQDNLILVDDIPFQNIVHFNQSLGEEDEIGAGGRYSIFAPNLIAGADFQPGGWGAKYSGRSGSFLNLEVADGNSASASNSIRLDLAGLEYTYDGPSKIHDNTSFIFSARHLDFGSFFETIDIPDIGSPVLTDVILKTTTEINSENTLKLLAIYAPEEFTRDIDNIVIPDFDEEVEDYSIVDVEQDNALYAATWDTLVGDNSSLTNRIYYRNLDKTSSQGEAFTDLVPEGTPNDQIPVRERILTIEEEETELGLISDLSIGNALGRLDLGINLTQLDLDYETSLEDDWNRYIYDQTDFRPDPDVKYITLTPENVNSELSLSELSYGLYGEQTFELDEWSIRTGLRYDYDAFADENLVSPRLGLTWNVSDTLALNSTAGIFYQSPQALARASDSSNADLQNEEVQQFSLGFKKQLSFDWSLLTEVYYQNLENLIVDNDRVTGIANNNGDGFSYGSDIVLNKTFSDRYSASVNYSYNQSKRDNNDGLGEFYADYHRPHAFSVSGVWEISQRWKISGRWKTLSGKPDDSFIVHDNVLGDGELLRFSKEIQGNNDERFDSYNTFNFRVDYRRNIGPTDVVAFLDVINVFGSDNPNAADFNDRTGESPAEEGDTFPLLGLRLEF